MTAKTHGPVLVAGHSYYLPAMSNGGLFKGYVIDPELCRESLKKIKGLDFDHVVPGHGEPMERDEAMKAADFHMGELDRIDKIILDLLGEPVSTECLVTKFSSKMDLYKNLNNYWLTLVMLKGHLSSLNNKGKVAYRLENYCMYWYRI